MYFYKLTTVVSISNMSIFRCYTEGISMTFILSCTTLMCFQMNCSATPRCHLTRGLNIHKKPSGWSFVIRELLTPVSRALQRWAFHTSWAAQTFWSNTFWSIGRTSWQYLSEFTLPLAGLWLICEDMQIICNRSQHVFWTTERGLCTRLEVVPL